MTQDDFAALEKRVKKDWEDTLSSIEISVENDFDSDDIGNDEVNPLDKFICFKVDEFISHHPDVNIIWKKNWGKGENEKDAYENSLDFLTRSDDDTSEVVYSKCRELLISNFDMRTATRDFYCLFIQVVATLP